MTETCDNFWVKMAILANTEAASAMENRCVFFDKMCDVFQSIRKFWMI